MFDVDSHSKTSLCLDCHRHIEEFNDCLHYEVSVSMVETVGTRLVPRSYRCDHCGVELEERHLSSDVWITNFSDRLNIG